MSPYYDHERAYARIRAAGGTGWDDLGWVDRPGATGPAIDVGSYVSIRAFLDSAVASGHALELGCGGGQVSLELARRGYRVTGVDFSASAIELARDNARSAGIDATFVVGDVLDLAALGLAEASFDLVVDNHLMHCLVAADHRARALAGAFRVLVPGGRLWSETMSFVDGGFDAAAVRADPVTGVALDGYRLWVRREVFERELRAAGFAIESMVARHEPPPETGTDLVTVARRPP